MTLLLTLINGITALGYLGSAVCYLLHFLNKRTEWGRKASWLLLVALLVHSLSLVVRSWQSGHLPFASLFESMLFYSWLVALVYGLIELNTRNRTLGTFVVPLVLIMQGISALFLGEIQPLKSVLDNPLFGIHVATSFMGYTAFSFSFVSSLLYTLQVYQISSRRVGIFFARLPPLETLDQMNYKSVLIGLLFLTLGIGTGAIYASQAWGAFFSWDVKIACTVITWFIYAVQLQVRLVSGWQGKRSAYLSMIGFSAVLFTYLGAGLLFTELHFF